MDEERSQKVDIVTGAILVAIASAVTYLYVFQYEIGYADYFGIPHEFVTLELTTILQSATIIIGLLFFIFPTANLIALILPNREHPLYRALIYMSVLLCYLFLLIILYGSHWKEWILMMLAFLFVLLLEFGWPLLTQPGNKSYLEKYISSQEAEARTASRSLLGRIFAKIGSRNFWIIWILVMIYPFCYSVGKSKAMNKKEFLLYGKNQNMAVLAIYGDLLICAKFDNSTKEISDQYSFIKISQKSRTVSVQKEVGPLHLKKKFQPGLY